ncbi:TPA: DUF859 family phage minor structural protein [Streptococcus suis]
MAKFSNASGSLYLNVYIEPNAPNYANNTTVVNWRMTVSRTGAYYTYNENGDSTLSLDLNGSRAHTSNPRWHTSGEEFQMASGSTTVGHNADGTKSFGFSARFNPNNGLHGVITVSGNIGLKTIPRATTPTLSNSNPVMGTTITINLPRASNSFTHSIFHDFYDGKWTQITTGAGTSYPWTVPLDLFAPRIPNATSGGGRIQVDTWNGGTLIGSKIVNFTASVPTSVVPTIDTKKVEETVAGLNTQFGTYVQNKSKIKATMTASGAYSSTIKSYKITVNGETFNSATGTTSELKTSGTNRVNFEVTDSRGRKATSYIDISVTAYENPKILSVSAIRCNDDGTTNDEGTYAKISFNASAAPVGNKNTKAFVVKYKQTGSPTWTEVDVTGATYSTDTYTIIAGFDVDYAYDIQLYVADYFTSVTFSPTPLSTGFTMINYHPDGKAVAFGEVSDGFGFSVNMNAQFKKSVDIAGNVYASDMFIAGQALRDIFYPIGSIFQSIDETDPSTFIGGTWERFGNGRVLVGVDEEDSDFNTPNKTGGEKSHTLTIAEIPSHTHGQNVTANNTGSAIRRDFDSDGSAGIYPQGVQTEATGGGQAHNNLQPYITVYMWRRTA